MITCGSLHLSSILLMQSGLWFCGGRNRFCGNSI